MGWTIWLVLGVATLGLYLLGLVGYRGYLNAKSLLGEIHRAKSLISEAQAFEPLPIQPAKPAGEKDLAKVLRDRRTLERKKREAKAARAHRLVQRIREIEIDKR